MLFDVEDCEDSAAIVFSITHDGTFRCEIVSDVAGSGSKMTDVATVCVTIFEDWLEKNGVTREGENYLPNLTVMEPKGSA